MDIKNTQLNSSKIFLFIFLFFLPFMIIGLNGFLIEYLKSFIIGILFCLVFRLPFLLYCSGYLWASALSIFIANWHISLSSEPYVINLVGGGSDDRAFANSVLNPISGKVLSPYSQLLNFFSLSFLNFSDISFYSLLSINCFFHALGASAIFKIIRKLNYGNFAERFSFFSYLFFPILLIDGLTLVRDGIIASLISIFISILVTNKNIISFRLYLIIFSVCFVRLGSGLLLIISTFATWFFTIKSFFLKKRFLIFISFLLITIFLSYEKIINYLLWKEIFENLFIRSTFVEFHSSVMPNANINYIYSLPFGFKQLALFLYFLFAPFGQPIDIFSKDTYSFFAAIFSIWNVFSIKLCIQDFIYQIRNYKNLNDKKYFQILYFFIISIYIIANYSIQLRHKSFVIPLQIILTAHSLKRNKIFDYSFSWIAALPYALLIVFG